MADKIIKLKLLKSLRIKESKAEVAKSYKEGDVVELEKDSLAVKDLLGRNVAEEVKMKKPISKEAK